MVAQKALRDFKPPPTFMFYSSLFIAITIVNKLHLQFLDAHRDSDPLILDSDHDVDRHQNLIALLLCHAPPPKDFKIRL